MEREQAEESEREAESSSPLSDPEVSSAAAFIDLGLNGSSMVSRGEPRQEAIPVPWLVVPAHTHTQPHTPQQQQPQPQLQQPQQPQPSTHTHTHTQASAAVVPQASPRGPFIPQAGPRANLNPQGGSKNHVQAAVAAAIARGNPQALPRGSTIPQAASVNPQAVPRVSTIPQAVPQAVPQANPQANPQAAMSWKEILSKNNQSSFQSCLDDVFG